MSFQGDVGGIGLAELLQSLARGRREGILTLNADCGLACTLGLENGVIYLLPQPDEDPRVWQERARQAWVKDHDLRVDAIRTAEIARAHRIELVYRLLDSEGVHFRFENEPLPRRAAEQGAHKDELGANPPRMPQVHCEGVSVEYLLLEYARMSDEQESLGGPSGFSDHVVPRALDLTKTAQGNSRFLQECDGASSVAEITDRLGWPIRQGRLLVAGHVRARSLRLASARELLVLAQKELERGHLARTASRLSAWVQAAAPGPLDEGDAGLLDAEWKAERMSALLNKMPTREARILMRRLDHAQADPVRAVRHWRELQRLRKHDALTGLHRIACEQRDETDADSPSLRELLELASSFRKEEHPRRAAVILRLAAARQPTATAAQLDIGLGLLAAGRPEEGAPWILEAAARLIESRAAHKTIAPLRALAEADPTCREARRLLSRARSRSVRKQLVRRHSLIGLAVVVALGLGAWIQVGYERRSDERLVEIQALLTDPAAAQALLERHFADDDSPQVEDLRQTIAARLKGIEAAERAAWYEQFRSAQLECTLGEVTLGLERALELPAPPRLATVEEPWPLVSDLFNGLAARLESQLQELGPAVLDDPGQVQAEERLGELLEGVLERTLAAAPGEDGGDMVERLGLLQDELRRRAEGRAHDVAARERLDLLARQDLLLAAARAHAEAGDLERALVAYAGLCESDESGRLAELFGVEIEGVRARHQAVLRARELAGAGEHAAAREVLAASLADPDAQPLPWTLDSFPSGATVELAAGAPRRTPTVLESRFEERLQMTLRAAHCEPFTLIAGEPADRFIWLSRLCDRRLASEGRIEAPPVGVELDHVVCDRAGRVRLLTADAGRGWERRLSSLGGIARAPVFLPQRPGHLLLVTEDGEAWIVSARSGEIEGPWRLGSPPAEGPVATPDGVRARLKDGREVLWTRRLRPEQAGARSDEAALDAARAGSDAGLALLRRADGARRLDSPWNGWSVAVTAEVFRATRDGEPDGGFAVRRAGEWVFLAWEAPHGKLPGGRLWVSDEAGLRAFEP